MALFNDSWQFALGEPNNFESVSIPHDWLIADTADLYRHGVGWYRKIFDAGFVKPDQRVFLRFDGVFMDCVLFVNGTRAGEWKYGFTAFEFDITSLIRGSTPNEILLKVDYRSPSARWYTGAGMYRDVSLIVKERFHFVSDGIYVTTAKRDGAWSFSVDAEVENGGTPYETRHVLLGAENGIEEWDIDHPRRYVVRSELLVDGKVWDTVDTPIGFRTVAFDPVGGFSLNGRRVPLRGVCLHHDHGALGAAESPEAIRRQIETFRAMGANAIRTAHNPPSERFMEIADEMGVLVLSEIFDTWRQAKNDYDYARFFDEWHERDVASWIRRDRNRASVIMWSVGNEIPDTHLDAEEGGKTLARLLDLVKKHDPAGHAPATLCSNYLPWENTQKCADSVKLVGYNYGERLYGKHRDEHPDWVIYGSETCSTAQSRAIYHFPLSKPILADDDLQCSALGNSPTSWGSKSVEACLRTDLDAPFSAGQFLWAGQDYIGEPTPYHTKSSYLGHVDTAGFPKDTYYVIQAAWTDYRVSPMVHVFPYWDFSPGQPVDVRVCSNAPCVELFLNGESLGSRDLDGARGEWVADWRVPYSPGEISAVARDVSGKIIARESRKSFGEAAELRLEAKVYGDVSFVEITAVDERGTPVENANRRARVTVENGELLGLDNGDSADFDQYKTDSRRLFGGKLLAIARGRAGVPAKVRAEFDGADIPIRKIELAVDGYAVTAKILPENASYRDLSWRLTDARGIDSPLGVLKLGGDGLSGVIEPKGDGEIYARCSANNGLDHASIISAIPLVIEGMGKTRLDPYSFVSGGLCDASNVELTSGNERGVATLREGESHVGFRDVDFGEAGSDEITVSLFPLAGDPFDFGIWDGMPGEGGSLVMNARYDKGTIWNTYQDATYVLPRKLRGVKTLCLTFRRKVHVKGFRFARWPTASRKTPATAYERIYGDSFSVESDAVTGIGNNVSIEFGSMDFGETGLGAVALRWRSKNEGNPVQAILSDDDGTTRIMIPAGRADDWREETFPLGETLRGVRSFTLSFLPGCSIDLAWFKFLP